MSAVLLLALMLQVFSILLLRLRLGRGWFWHPFSLLMMMACVYHGLAAFVIEVLQPDGVSIYRRGVSPQAIDTATLIVSLSILAGAVGYVLIRRPVSPDAAEPASWRAARVVDWRFSLLLTLPLVWVTANGQGLTYKAVFVAENESLVTQLAQEALTLSMVVTGLLIVWQAGKRWFLPVFVVEIVTVAFVGQRLEVLLVGASLVVLLIRVGVKVDAKQLWAISAMAVIAIAAIAGVRSTSGRDLFYSDAGPIDRVLTLASGVSSSLSGSEPVGLSVGPGDAIASRLDGSSYAAVVQDRIDVGYPLAGWWVVPSSLIVAIPSRLLSDKYAIVASASPELLAIKSMGAPTVDYIPGFFGLYYPAIGAAGLPVFGFFLGLGYALAENWAWRRLTMMRIVILAALAQGAMYFERGLPSLGLALRAAVLVGIVLVVARRVIGPRSTSRAGIEAPGNRIQRVTEIRPRPKASRDA